MIEKEQGFRYLIGIEREGLRCDAKGVLASSMHPSEFGDRMKNRFITTDFGEEQIELRTLPCHSPEECYYKLLTITRTVLEQLEKRGEYIWPYSMPCTLPEEEDYIYNDYTDHPEEEIYERYLSKKYGYRRLCISGVHFNFSVEQTTFGKLRSIYPDIPADIDDAYMRCIRGIYRVMNVFAYFFDASPTDMNRKLIKPDSFRNSTDGYNNGLFECIDVSSKAGYVDSVQRLLDEGKISRMGELYIPVRAREAAVCGIPKLDVLRSLSIVHIELRMFDIDPFDICGISCDSISLATAFIFCCFIHGEDVPEDIKAFISECDAINNKLNLGLSAAITDARDKANSGNDLAGKIRRQIEGHTFDPAGTAVSYTEAVVNDREIIPYHGTLESSTKMMIQDAVMLGIDHNIIDEKRCIVDFLGYRKNEVIVQATRTSRDSYIFEYVTDDKLYTRKAFSDAGICVPKTLSVTREQTEGDDFEITDLINGPSAVKPKSANYGNGITLFEKTPSAADMQAALKYALEYDDTVLIEEYISGCEYRFFLIDGKVRSVVNRVPANVTGDGIHTIKELIAIKESPRRFRRWEKKITVNETTYDLLGKHGIDMDTIPVKGERIFLQKASNASLGGETVDVTNEMPDRFKEIAEKAAKLFNAFICGADIIIPDISGEKYALLEINDNPGMFICEVPVVGKERRLGQEILIKLGLGM